MNELRVLTPTDRLSSEMDEPKLCVPKEEFITFGEGLQLLILYARTYVGR